MKLFFLGTGAAEGFPGIFCNCENCREARALGGKSLRFRSALLVNDDLLIDFGPDLLASAIRFNKNFSGVTTGLVTHAHTDHFYIGNFEMRKKDFTGQLDIPTLRLFGSHDVKDMLTQAFDDFSELRLDVTTVKAFDTWKENGYSFTAYRAYHAIDHLEALFYSVEDGQHAFLYATDTGSFPEDTWQALAGKSFDVIILEETLGNIPYSQHMTVENFLNHMRRMTSAGMLRPGGRMIAHHMSHSGNPTHEKIEAILGPHGIEVAYDGMEIVLEK
jgi:phosphoribosyl 1,2-cyclic phosphate phosphodiesterase